ncbi:MAG: GerAB/ArcD/ProY family transporter [Firmicutes bacterium]|nr:GerAB/ArcD/ProY family transporter [Bacillota bacterium]
MNSQSARSLSSRQVTLIIVGFTIGAGILTLPSAAAELMGASGWVWVLATGLLFTGAAWVAVKFAQQAPGETLVEYSQKLLGKPLGILYSLFFAAYFFSFLPVETRVLQELVNISLLPTAPTWFVSGSFIFVMAYGASRDIKQLAQVNELLIEIALLTGVFVVILAWQHFEPKNLMPFLAQDQLHLGNLKVGIGTAFAYAGFQSINLILPYIKQPQEAAKATLKALLTVVGVYTFFTISVIGVFGYKETMAIAWSGLELAKSVNLEAIILERLDLILLIAWLSAIYTTGLLTYYMAALTLSKIWRLPSHAPIVWAMAPLIYYLSTLLKNYFTWNEWSFYISLLTLAISFVFTPLLYLLSLLKKRGERSG